MKAPLSPQPIRKWLFILLVGVTPGILWGQDSVFLSCLRVFLAGSCAIVQSNGRLNHRLRRRGFGRWSLCNNLRAIQRGIYLRFNVCISGFD